jgi:hypothetical protein
LAPTSADTEKATLAKDRRKKKTLSKKCQISSTQQKMHKQCKMDLDSERQNTRFGGNLQISVTWDCKLSPESFGDMLGDCQLSPESFGDIKRWKIAS